MLTISKDIEKGTETKEQMESEIMAKLQDHMMSSKAEKQTSQLVARLHQRKIDLVWYLVHLGGQGKETGCSHGLE